MPHSSMQVHNGVFNGLGKLLSYMFIIANSVVYVNTRQFNRGIVLDILHDNNLWPIDYKAPVLNFG